MNIRHRQTGNRGSLSVRCHEKHISGVSFNYITVDRYILSVRQTNRSSLLTMMKIWLGPLGGQSGLYDFSSPLFTVEIQFQSSEARLWKTEFVLEPEGWLELQEDTQWFLEQHTTLELEHEWQTCIGGSFKPLKDIQLVRWIR